MPAMGLPSTPSRRSTQGAGQRLCERLRTQIAEGILANGARLPSTRALAADLGLSRTTVTAAYEQLAAEGYLVTAPGRVARVAQVAAVVPMAPLAQLAQPKRRAPLVPQHPSGLEARQANGPMRSAERPAVTTHRPDGPGVGTGPMPRLSAYGQRLSLQPVPDPSPPVGIDFLYGAVAAKDFPLQPWRRALQAERSQPQRHLSYVEPEGDPGLRRALQGYLGRARGIVCHADQVLIVNGSQQGIDLTARVLLDPGDTVVVEEPGYLSARRSFEAAGARCFGAPVDEQGLVTQALPDDPAARLAYVTPSHQFPLGGVLPVGRRHELLRWAERQQAWVLEDDYDGEFRHGQRPIDALQAIDLNRRVLYLGTFSKALSPQLRLGYLVLPSALVPVFAQAKRLADRHAPVTHQRALAHLIDTGAYERHVRRTRREHGHRRTALLDAVAQHLPADARLAGTAAGLHAVLWLPAWQPADEPDIVRAARSAGVGVYPVSALYAQHDAGTVPRPAGLILGYASLTPGQVAQGIRLLGRVLRALTPR